MIIADIVPAKDMINVLSNYRFGTIKLTNHLQEIDHTNITTTKILPNYCLLKD
jgi:hypothetical protein